MAHIFGFALVFGMLWIFGVFRRFDNYLADIKDEDIL
jgi:hypothetical protein